MSNEETTDPVEAVSSEEEEVDEDVTIEDVVEEEVFDDDELTEVEVSESEGDLIEEIIDDRFEDVHRMPTLVEEDYNSASTNLDHDSATKPLSHPVPAGSLLENVRPSAYKVVTPIKTTVIECPPMDDDDEDDDQQQQEQQHQSQPRIPGKEAFDDWTRALSVNEDRQEGIEQPPSPRTPGREALSEWEYALSLISRNADAQDSRAQGAPEPPFLFSNPGARIPSGTIPVGGNSVEASNSGPSRNLPEVDQQISSDNKMKKDEHAKHDKISDDGIRVSDFDSNTDDQGTNAQNVGDGIRVYDYDTNQNEAQDMNDTIAHDNNAIHQNEQATNNDRIHRESIRVYDYDPNENEHATNSDPIIGDGIRVYDYDVNEEGQTMDDANRGIPISADASNNNDDENAGGDEANYDFQNSVVDDSKGDTSYAFKAKPKADNKGGNAPGSDSHDDEKGRGDVHDTKDGKSRSWFGSKAKSPGSDVPSVDERKVDVLESGTNDNNFDSSYAYKAKPKADKKLGNTPSESKSPDDDKVTGDVHDTGLNDGKSRSFFGFKAKPKADITMGKTPPGSDIPSVAEKNVDVNESGTNDSNFDSSYAFKAKPKADKNLGNSPSESNRPDDDKVTGDVHDTRPNDGKPRSFFGFKAKPKADKKVGSTLPGNDTPPAEEGKFDARESGANDNNFDNSFALNAQSKAEKTLINTPSENKIPDDDKVARDVHDTGPNDGKPRSFFGFKAKPKADKKVGATLPGNDTPTAEERKFDAHESGANDNNFDNSFALNAQSKADKNLGNTPSESNIPDDDKVTGDVHDTGPNDGKPRSFFGFKAKPKADKKVDSTLPGNDTPTAEAGKFDAHGSGANDNNFDNSFSFNAQSKADKKLGNTPSETNIPDDDKVARDVDDTGPNDGKSRSFFGFKAKPKADKEAGATLPGNEITDRSQKTGSPNPIDDNEVSSNIPFHREIEASLNLSQILRASNNEFAPTTEQTTQQSEPDEYPHSSTIGPPPFGDSTGKPISEGDMQEAKKEPVHQAQALSDEDNSYHASELVQGTGRVAPKAVSLGFKSSGRFAGADDSSSDSTMHMLSLEEQSAEFLVLPGLGADPLDDSQLYSSLPSLPPVQGDVIDADSGHKGGTEEFIPQTFNGIENEELTENTNDDDYLKRKNDSHLEAMENGASFGDDKEDESKRRMKVLLCIQCCAVLIILILILLWIFVFRNDDDGESNKDGVVPSQNFTLSPGIPTLPPRSLSPAVISVWPPTLPPRSLSPVTISPVSLTNPPQGTSNETSSPTAFLTLPTTNDTVRRWQQTGYFVSPSAQVSSYGTTVSIGTTQMAVGAPSALENGAVFTYKSVNGTWIQDVTTSQLFGVQPDSRFGASLDMTDELLVVGAPNINAPGTTTPVGAAYVYGHYGTLGAPDGWAPIGRTLYGDSGMYGAFEEFGTSVATSDNNRVVVIGAPKSSLGDISGRGRVYTYQLDGSGNDWELMHDVSGYVAEGNLGTAVDISSDGSLFLAGAPGTGNGYASLYKWNGSNWESVSQVQGDGLGEGFGSSVKILTPDASTFAVGAPYHNGDQGIVVVFTKINEEYVQLGQSIVGLSGEFLGSTNMISTVPNAGMSLVLGTASGGIKKYDFDASAGSWIQVGELLKKLSTFSQLANSPQSAMVIVGDDEEATIYELK